MRLIVPFLALFATLSAQGKIETFKDLEVREWRNESNATLRGILGKYDTTRDAVYVMRLPSEGGSFWYPLNKLSAEDVAFVKNEVANLNKVVLPEKLSNQVYFTRPSYTEWKWYDPKYLVVEDPVVFNFCSDDDIKKAVDKSDRKIAREKKKAEKESKNIEG